MRLKASSALRRKRVQARSLPTLKASACVGQAPKSALSPVRSLPVEMSMLKKLVPVLSLLLIAAGPVAYAQSASSESASSSASTTAKKSHKGTKHKKASSSSSESSASKS
jgi:hypothetical protein